ncbi:MAG: GNAT family N-acetyltransferase [Oligoflexales bacterium]|nr:GNAT family N-acetyltransferase [Oligoflexales bacterium]
MIIRPANLNDAEILRTMYENLLAEKLPYILQNPVPTLEMQKEFLKTFDGISSIMLVSEDDGVLTGMCTIRKQMHQQLSHNCELSMSVSKQYRGKGIGSRLLLEAEKWAVANNIRRMELSVIQDNPAFKLYKRFGFSLEVEKKDRLKIDKEKYLNIIEMVKLIGHP